MLDFQWNVSIHIQIGDEELMDFIIFNGVLDLRYLFSRIPTLINNNNCWFFLLARSIYDMGIHWVSVDMDNCLKLFSVYFPNFFVIND